jgi:hypothetical protein
MGIALLTALPVSTGKASTLYCVNSDLTGRADTLTSFLHRMRNSSRKATLASRRSKRCERWYEVAKWSTYRHADRHNESKCRSDNFAMTWILVSVYY